MIFTSLDGKVGVGAGRGIPFGTRNNSNSASSRKPPLMTITLAGGTLYFAVIKRFAYSPMAFASPFFETAPP
jgi:hypothetical protein